MMKPSSTTIDSASVDAEFHGPDGTIIYGQDAIQAAYQHGLVMQEQRRRVVEALTPFQRHRLERELATGRFRPVPRTIVTLRPRRREHRPGAVRRTSSSSRTSGTDPGDDDPERSEPPLERRWHPRWGLCNARMLDLLAEVEA